RAGAAARRLRPRLGRGRRPARRLRHARRRRLHQRPRRVRPGTLLAALARRGRDLHGDRHGVDLRDAARAVIHALGAGVLFGIGLWLSGMANPRKVLDFLDVAGDWDPSLLLVMAGAVAVTAAFFRPLLQRKEITFDKTAVDAPLVAGAALFGLGWGLGGYCPGP